MKKILALSGSLRSGSFNTAIVESIKDLVPTDVEVVIAKIDTIPLYNQDLENNFPKEAQDFKDNILSADAIVISTPEYNRSFPGVLKNAIDWASRPYGKNAFAGKPVLVLGATGGTVGTALAQYHLKQVLSYLDANIVGQPELFIGGATDKIKDGVLIDEDTKDHIRKAIEVLLAK